MPIDFSDFLQSIRDDGKLIISTVIRAATGKKIVQDVRDTAGSIEFDLEDASGARTTATISKTGGGGGGEGMATPLSDDVPAAAGAAAGAAGTGTEASRDDHRHNVPNASTTVRGISEKATGGEATAGTNNEAHMTPMRVSQVFADRAGDAAPQNVGPAAAAVGTATKYSREDHVHSEDAAATEQRVLNQDPAADADTLGKLQIDPQGNAYTTTPDTEHGTAQDRRLRPVHPRRLHRGA